MTLNHHHKSFLRQRARRERLIAVPNEALEGDEPVTSTGRGHLLHRRVRLHRAVPVHFPHPRRSANPGLTPVCEHLPRAGELLLRVAVGKS